jgi:hypothetical protein
VISIQIAINDDSNNMSNGIGNGWEKCSMVVATDTYYAGERLTSA